MKFPLKKNFSFPKFIFLKKLLLASKKLKTLLFFAVIALFVSGSFLYKAGYVEQFAPRFATNQKEIHVAFLLEIYDKIMENYWEKVEEEKLANLYKLATEKVTGKTYNLDIQKDAVAPNPVTGDAALPPSSPAGDGVNKLVLEGNSLNDLKVKTDKNNERSSSTKQALEKLLNAALNNLDDAKKKEYTVNIAAAVLANLQPFGRSGLFTTKQEEVLNNTVQNINPDKDLYKDIGIDKGASKEEVAQAVEKKAEELKKQSTPEAKKELERLAYTKDVLTDEDKKGRYDTQGIEPTVFHKYYTQDIVYLRFLKYSPTTYDEFVKLVSTFDKENGPKALILDLRTNIGGAIDFLPYFLGNFLGKNQVAFEMFQQGEFEPFKTTTDRLPGLSKLRQTVVLIDSQTQSSAELMSAALKKYRFAVLVGERTKGWGTVERIFPLENQFDKSEKYSMFLVHHITIRDDGEPIEGKGVIPNISLKSNTLEKDLYDYFRYPEFTEAVKKALQEPIRAN